MRHWLYLKSLMRHKWYVFFACLTFRVSLWRAIKHDWTKFLPCEWFPYARYFYGQKLKVGDKVSFNSIDGFGGVAEIIEWRDTANAHWKIRVQNGYVGESQEFWAHDFEIDFDTGETAFNRAWNHHQKANDHHWQYWLLTMDSGDTFPLDMPEMSIREMVADWCGAGRAYVKDWTPNQPLNWYKKNAHKIQLTQKTRNLVEALLGEYAEKGKA